MRDRPNKLRDASALAKLRIAAGLSQAAAAAKLEVAVNSLSNVERGSVPASNELLERMAAVYAATENQVVRAYRAGRREQFLVREGL